tara:strand:- start:549 stop:1187 length:639 start_codon:yes stop_codon:yes gene_type:complete
MQIIHNFSCFVLCSIAFFSCEQKYKNLEFPEEIDYFKPELYSHFPKRIPTLYSQLVVSQDLSGAHPHIWLLYYDVSERLDSIQHNLLRNTSRFHSNDSCLLVIDQHLNPTNKVKFDKMARVPRKYKYRLPNCNKLSPPIPKFYSENWYQNDNSKIGLDGWNLYVIESDSGIFMNEDKLPNGLYTPPNWKHGYSKGIAVNEKDNAIIYWADIW